MNNPAWKTLRKILVLIFFFLASPLAVPSAQAAIAILDAPANALGEICDPCTATMTISAGSTRKFICAVGSEDTSTPAASGVTFNGITMTAAIKVTTPTDGNAIELWYLDEASLPAPGSYTVSVDFADPVGDFGMTCWSVSGIASGAPKDTDSFASDTATTATLSLTGVVSTDWVFTAAVANEQNTNMWTHGGTQTEMSDLPFGAAPSATMSTSRAAGQAAPSSTENGSAVRFAMIAAVWAEVAAKSVPGYRPLFLD
jgi:hypothetical protein